MYFKILRKSPRQNNTTGRPPHSCLLASCFVRLLPARQSASATSTGTAWSAALMSTTQTTTTCVSKLSVWFCVCFRTNGNLANKTSQLSSLSCRPIANHLSLVLSVCRCVCLCLCLCVRMRLCSALACVSLFVRLCVVDLCFELHLIECKHMQQHV